MYWTHLQDGYKIKVNKLQACDGSGTVKIINPKIELTKDCLVVADGCAQITKGFSKCKVCLMICQFLTASQRVRNQPGGNKKCFLVAIEFYVFSIFTIAELQIVPLLHIMNYFHIRYEILSDNQTWSKFKIWTSFLGHRVWPWVGLGDTQRQARELISGPCLCAKARILSFNRIQSMAVTDLLTGHTLRRYLPPLGLSDFPLRRRCEAEEETSAHTLCECEALASLRHAYLGFFFLEPEDILGTIWKFSKVTGLPWIDMGHKWPIN
jgi:hypothetical protein